MDAVNLNHSHASPPAFVGLSRRDAPPAALKALQQSIAAGRTMTWPNFRRLAQRTNPRHAPTDFPRWRTLYQRLTHS